MVDIETEVSYPQQHQNRNTECEDDDEFQSVKVEKATFKTAFSKKPKLRKLSSIRNITSVYKDSMSSYCEELISPLVLPGVDTGLILTYRSTSELLGDKGRLDSVFSSPTYRGMLESDSSISVLPRGTKNQIEFPTSDNGLYRKAQHLRHVQLKRESMDHNAIRKARHLSKGSFSTAKQQGKSRKFSNLPIGVIERSLRNSRKCSKRNATVLSTSSDTNDILSSSRNSFGSYCEGVISPVVFSVDPKYLMPSHLLKHTRDFSRCRDRCKCDSTSEVFRNQSQDPDGGEEGNLTPFSFRSRHDNYFPSDDKHKTVFNFSSGPQQTDHSSIYNELFLPRKYLEVLDVNNNSSSGRAESMDYEEPYVSYCDSDCSITDEDSDECEDSVDSKYDVDLRTTFQYMELMKTLQEHAQQVEENLVSDVRYLHMKWVEMFARMDDKTHRLVEQCSVNSILLEEKQKLLQENKQLLEVKERVTI